MVLTIEHLHHCALSTLAKAKGGGCIEDAYGDGPPPPTFEIPTVVAALKYFGCFCGFWCFCIFCLELIIF